MVCGIVGWFLRSPAALATGIGNEVMHDACVRCVGVVPDLSDLATEQAQDSCVQYRLGDNAMASNLRIFFAGVGTTFILLGVGFGGGLMMAKSALEEPTGGRLALLWSCRRLVSSFHLPQKRRCRRKLPRNSR